MPEPSQPAAEPVDNRRPWYRLHLSTILMLIFAAVVLVLLVVPGDPSELLLFDSGAYFFEETRFEHGWPAVYLCREVVDANSSGDQLDTRFPWLSNQAWRYTDSASSFRLTMLMLDLAVAIGILVALCAAVEWRRRRHRRVWQFSLAEVLLLTFLISGALSWHRHNLLRHRREKGAVAVYNGFDNDSVKGPMGYMMYRGPVWLRKLAGADNLTAFHRVTMVDLQDGCFEDGDLDDEDLRSSVEQISQLSCLESLWISSGERERGFDEGEHVSDQGLSCLKRLPQLRTLWLRLDYMSDAGLVHLRSLKRLEELSVRGPITDDGLYHLRGLTKLRSLHVATHLEGRGLVHLAELK